MKYERGWGLAMTLVFGCSSPSHPTTSDAIGTDGTTNDATLLDAAPADGPNPDVPTSFECDPNAPPGLVQVHTPAAGVTIIANDVNGTYVGRTVTNGAGTAAIMVPGCGSVTSIHPGLYSLVSDVRSGDEIWPDGKPSTTVAEGTLRIFIDAPYPGASSYMFSGPASVAAVSPNVYEANWRDTSATGAPVLLVVQPVDSANPVRGDAYAVVVDAKTAGSELHVTSWLTSPPPRHFTVQAPSTFEVVYATVAPESNGMEYRQQGVTFSPASVNPSFDFSVPPVGTGNLVSLSIDAPGNVVYWVKDVGAPIGLSVTLDLTSDPLPLVSSASRSPDVSRPTVEWTLSSSNVQLDSIAIWAGSDQASWRILVPGSATSFRMPELPNDLAVTYALAWQPGLFLLESSDLPGYAAARRNPTQAYLAGRPYPDGVTFREVRYRTF